MHAQICLHPLTHMHKGNWGHALDTFWSMMGVRETVMDYGHIWAVISRSLSAAAFSRRGKSCIMLSHGRPGSLGCIMPCQRVYLVITGFTAQSRIKTALCGSGATVLKALDLAAALHQLKATQTIWDYWLKQVQEEEIFIKHSHKITSEKRQVSRLLSQWTLNHFEKPALLKLFRNSTDLMLSPNYLNKMHTFDVFSNCTVRKFMWSTL